MESENRSITPEEFLRINEKLKKTNEDTTVFPVLNDGKLSVVGDANKTEVKRNDYEVKFRMMAESFDRLPEGAKVVGPYCVFSVRYSNVTITPRKDMKLVAEISKVLPYFKKLKEDGEVEGLSDEELAYRFAYASDDILSAIYNLVATFLDIADGNVEYMLPFSVISALNDLIDNHPEVFNESDIFFG